MALTTLAYLKTALGITTSANDAQITQFINSASARIENWSNRKFGAQNCIEWHDGGAGLAALRTPLNYVNAIKVVDGSYFQVQYNGADKLARVDVTAGTNSTAGKLRLTSSTAGATIIPLTGTLEELVVAINLVSGWSASFVGQPLYGKAAWVPPLAGLDATVNNNAQGPAVVPVAMGDMVISRYEVESGVCQLTNDGAPYAGTNFWIGGTQFSGLGLTFVSNWYTNPNDLINYPRVFQGICLDYNGGLDPIPDDVQQTCVDLVQMMLQSATNQSMLLGGEALGGYSYSNAKGGDLGAALKSYDDLIKQRLAGYYRYPLPA